MKLSRYRSAVTAVTVGDFSDFSVEIALENVHAWKYTVIAEIVWHMYGSTRVCARSVSQGDVRAVSG